MAKSIKQVEIAKELELLFDTARLHLYLESLGEYELPESTKKILAAVERLNTIEKKMIRMKYLEEDNVRHITVYRALQISPMTYDEIRWNSFRKIAMALGLMEIKQHALAL